MSVDRRLATALVPAAVLSMGFAMLAPSVADASAPAFAGLQNRSGWAVEGLPSLPAPTISRESAAPGVLVADDGRVVAGNPVTAPLKWAGEWIWTQDDGSVSACTAQFITDRVILLAAHCIRNRATGKFYTLTDKNSGFLLQYQNHDFSRAYHAVCQATWGDWVVPLQPGEDPDKPDTMSDARRKQYWTAIRQSWQWDFGFVLLDGESITGHYNYRINQHWNGAVSTGYPGKLMGGEVIQAIEGDVFDEHDVRFSQGEQGNEQVLWHGNPEHTQGASGGAWVVNMSPNVSPDTNLIVGINSYDNSRKPGASFGPFFTDKFETLLEFTANGCK